MLVRFLLRPVRFLRMALAVTWATLSLVLFIPLALLALPIDRRQRVHDVCSILWARGILGLVGARLVVRGAEHVSRDERYIIVANHPSMLDGMVMVAALQPLTPVRMVAGRSALYIPLVGWGMRLFGHILVDPRSIRASLPGLQQAQHSVRQRWSIVFFPEGRLSDDGKPRPFYNSAFHIASRAGARVLPVTLSGAHELLPSRRLVPARSGEIHVILHPPMGPLGQTHDAAVAASSACHQLVASALPPARRDEPSPPQA